MLTHGELGGREKDGGVFFPIVSNFLRTSHPYYTVETFKHTLPTYASSILLQEYPASCVLDTACWSKDHRLPPLEGPCWLPHPLHPPPDPSITPDSEGTAPHSTQKAVLLSPCSPACWVHVVPSSGNAESSTSLKPRLVFIPLFNY